MKIVILNECFFREEHISKLKELGYVEIYKDTDNEEKAIKRIGDADVIIADPFFTPLNAKVMNSSKQLKFIALNTTGYDTIDLVSAKERNILVSNVPNYSTDAVAEHAIALMFSIIRKISLGDKEIRKNKFDADIGNPTHKKYLGFNLKGKILGIIGLGNIGIRLSELAQGIGIKVIAYNRSKKEVKNVRIVGLDYLLKESDIISLNLALTKETEKIIGKQQLKLMKNNAILINTARGNLIDTEALYNALKNKDLGGAALDVISDIDNNHPIFNLENIVFTPHIAWFTKESFDNLAESIVNNVCSFVQENPVNVINRGNPKN